MKKNLINNIRYNYNNGIMIRNEVWDKLSAVYDVLGTVKDQQDYLKLQATIRNFTECSVEDYELLVKSNNVMFTTLINLFDYLEYNTDGNKDVLKDDKEAKKLLEACLKTIEELKEELEVYYEEEL